MYFPRYLFIVLKDRSNIWPILKVWFSECVKMVWEMTHRPQIPSFKAKDLWYQCLLRITQSPPSGRRHPHCPRKEALIHEVAPRSPLSLWATDLSPSLQTGLCWALWADGFHSVWSLADLSLNTTMSKFIPAVVAVVSIATPILFFY